MQRRREHHPSAIDFLPRPLQGRAVNLNTPARHQLRPGGFINISTASGVGGSDSPMPPLTSTSASITRHGPGGMPYCHPQDAIMGGATWSVGHHGEVFGVTAP